MSASILARNEPPALANPLAAYRERFWSLPDEPPFTPRSDTPLLRLSAVTLATLRHDPITRPVLPATRGTVSEASMRLVGLNATGTKTAWALAEELQGVYFTGNTRGFTRGLDVYKRIPRKGLDLLRGIDALGLVPFWCDIEDPSDWRRFQTVRLSAALARTAL